MRSTSFALPKTSPMRWCSALGLTPSTGWRPVLARPPACSHQVHVQRHVRAVGPHAVRFDGLRDGRADGQVRHVLLVHHVEVAARSDALPVCAAATAGAAAAHASAA
jgi:hypothetical protein